MEKEYQNLIQPTENSNIGFAIQNLINDNLKFIKTSYLAQITNIEDNKITIKPLLKQKEDDNTLILHNVLIGFSYSQHWQTQFKLKINDIGLAIVIENDITHYKQTGDGGLNNTKRFKDVNDSIFIPLSLYTTLKNDDINFIIQNDTKKCKLEFDNNEIGILKGKLLTLESETTSLKKKFKELADLLEGMAGGSTSATGHGHVVTTSPGSIGKFNKWYSALDTLLKD
ncbi:TPA: hypothetical protein RTG66_001564 [Campylobacter jejuni]|nr:hypothetical protein [Campylobacter jejuni]